MSDHPKTALDGGPAFPRPGVYDQQFGGVEMGTYGMSLRDYAAIHADLTAVKFPDIEACAEYMGETTPRDFFGALELSARAAARIRYLYADAMIAARKGGPADV